MFNGAFCAFCAFCAFWGCLGLCARTPRHYDTTGEIVFRVEFTGSYMEEQAIQTPTKSHVILELRRELCIMEFVPSALYQEPHDVSIRRQHTDPTSILCLYFTPRTARLTTRLQYIHIYTLDFIKTGHSLGFFPS